MPRKGKVVGASSWESLISKTSSSSTSICSPSNEPSLTLKSTSEFKQCEGKQVETRVFKDIKCFKCMGVDMLLDIVQTLRL